MSNKAFDEQRKVIKTQTCFPGVYELIPDERIMGITTEHRTIQKNAYKHIKVAITFTHQYMLKIKLRVGKYSICMNVLFDINKLVNR